MYGAAYSFLGFLGREEYGVGGETNEAFLNVQVLRSRVGPLVSGLTTEGMILWHHLILDQPRGPVCTNIRGDGSQGDTRLYFSIKQVGDNDDERGQSGVSRGSVRAWKCT